MGPIVPQHDPTELKQVSDPLWPAALGNRKINPTQVLTSQILYLWFGIASSIFEMGSEKYFVLPWKLSQVYNQSFSTGLRFALFFNTSKTIVHWRRANCSKMFYYRPTFSKLPCWHFSSLICSLVSLGWNSRWKFFRLIKIQETTFSVIMAGNLTPQGWFLLDFSDTLHLHKLGKFSTLARCCLALSCLRFQIHYIQLANLRSCSRDWNWRT